jgi:hypothetical protein
MYKARELTFLKTRIVGLAGVCSGAEASQKEGDQAAHREHNGETDMPAFRSPTKKLMVLKVCFGA